MSQGLQVCNAGGLCRAMSGILKALMSLFQEALLRQAGRLFQAAEE